MHHVRNFPRDDRFVSRVVAPDPARPMLAGLAVLAAAVICLYCASLMGLLPPVAEGAVEPELSLIGP